MSSRLEEAAQQALGDLARLGGRMALVGGVAVSVRSTPRTTRDLDFAIAVSGDLEAEQLVFAFQKLGYQLYGVFEQTATQRLATARFSFPGRRAGEAGVDLLFASSGIEPEIVTAAERIEVLPGINLPIARLGHLLALKTLAHDDLRRPQDRIDVLALLQYATREELERARQALTLITSRGYHRGKNLLQRFEQFEELDRERRRA